MYIVSTDGTIHTIGVDLETYTDEMYDIIDKLNEFNDNPQKVLPEDYYKIYEV